LWLGKEKKKEHEKAREKRLATITLGSILTQSSKKRLVKKMKLEGIEQGGEKESHE